MYGTALSVTRDEVPPVHYMITLLGGPVRVAPYARFGSPELAQGSVDAMVGRSGVLLRNHGATTYGDTLGKAYTRSIYLEWVCKLYHVATQLGEPALLTQEQLDEVAEGIGAYGQSVKRGS
jgi:L-fuculose-phosphate aldolase